MPSGQEVTCFSGLGGGFDGNFVPFLGVPLKGSIRATIRDLKGLPYYRGQNNYLYHFVGLRIFHGQGSRHSRGRSRLTLEVTKFVSV